MFRLVLVIFAAILSMSVFAKRPGPVQVPDVVFEGVNYSVLHFAVENGTGQNGGYVQASEVSTGKRIVGKKIYSTSYNSSMESDVQDVFIKSMAIDRVNRVLVVVDEKGDVYRLELKTLRLLQSTPGHKTMAPSR